jgi:hypothetical protein
VKQPNPFFKLVALATSILLVGGFVCYRAGAFNRFLAADAPPADPASWPILEPNSVSTATESGTAAGEPHNGLSPEQQILFYTSKSGTIVPPSAIADSPPATAEPAPTLMPGSKSLGPIITGLTPATHPSSPAQPPAQTAPILMPGSKSTAILPVSKEDLLKKAPPKANGTSLLPGSKTGVVIPPATIP